MKLNVTVNGKECCFEIAPNEMLADVLRREGYRGVKIGCREGSCGACTVMFNGKPRNSCITLAAQAEGADIMTVEGLGNPDKPHLLQSCYVKHGAAQCGFCNPGSLISAKALLDRNPNPTEDDVKEALDGNLCRCTGYIKRIEAILDAAEQLREASKKDTSKPAKAAKTATKTTKSTRGKK